MPDEPIGIVEPQADATPNAEEPTEPTEATDQNEPQEDNEMQELWAETMPELADAYDKLDDMTQKKLLLKRLKANSQADRETTDTGRPETVTTSKNPETPSSPESFAVDPGAISVAIQQAMDDGDASPLAKVIADHQKWVTDTVGAMLTSFKDQDDRIEAVSLPGRFRDVRNTVSGATDGDIKAAMQLFKAGKASDPVTALKVAIYDRQQEVEAAKGKPRRTIDEDARRKAAAIRASNAGQSGGTAGNVAGRIPETDEEMRELLEAEAAEKKK